MESPSWTELGMKELEGQRRVGEISKKVQVCRFKWNGHVLRDTRQNVYYISDQPRSSMIYIIQYNRL